MIYQVRAEEGNVLYKIPKFITTGSGYIAKSETACLLARKALLAQRIRNLADFILNSFFKYEILTWF